MAALERLRVRTATGDSVCAAQFLKQPDVRLEHLVRTGQITLETDPGRESYDVASVETTIKYAGYLRRELSEVERSHRDEKRRIPSDFAFDRIPGLSREVVQRLSQIRPDTLGHAQRIPGITPAAIAVLASHINRVPPSV